MRKIFLILLIVTIIACSSRNNFQPYSSLVNQGFLPLSTSNAYVGANLFLSTEAQNSQYLYNFLKGRGGPMAIELTQSFKEPPHLLMYYPKENEVFAADLVTHEIKKEQFFREWVIRGPYAIERKDYKELSRLQASFIGEPIFIINGQEQRFRVTETERVKTILVPIVPTPLPTATPRPARKVIKHENNEEEHTIDTHQVTKPMNFDQQAILMSKGYAERAENGDLVHSAHAGENFDTIAKWYTGSANNATTISQLNNMDVHANLSEGQRILIPLKLLKTGKAMPADFK